jgi:hypothetical protein
VTADPALTLATARALGSAQLAFTALPWALCLLAYTGLHATYPADRRAALAAERVESEAGGATRPAQERRGRRAQEGGSSDSDSERRSVRSTGSAGGEAAGLLVGRSRSPLSVSTPRSVV